MCYWVKGIVRQRKPGAEAGARGNKVILRQYLLRLVEGVPYQAIG